MWALAIIGAIVAIFMIILLHECGHFLMARLCGVRVLRFSIGFGRPIWKHVARDGVEYCLGILPLGGYVKMLDEHTEDSNESLPSDAFPRAALWKRFLIVIAGPVMNMVIAILLFIVIGLMGVTQLKPIVGELKPHSIAMQAGFESGDEFMSIDGSSTATWQAVMLTFAVHAGDEAPLSVGIRRGKQSLLLSVPMKTVILEDRHVNLLELIGLSPYFPTSPARVAGVLPDSAAKKAGLRAGDTIESFAGKQTPTWSSLVALIRQSRGKTGSLVFVRDGMSHVVTVTLGSVKKDGHPGGFFGVQGRPPAYPASYLRHQSLSFWQAIPAAFHETWSLISMNARMLYKLLTGSISTKMLGGPISVFRAAGQATLAGAAVYLRFVAFISVTIGFVNILPIPGLDGGHVVYQLIECVLRRPLRVRTQQIGLVMGFAFLILIMIQATWNDVLSLWMG